MRIVHVITSLGLGGAERLLYDVLHQLSKKGDEHHVIFFKSGLYREKIEQLGITTHALPSITGSVGPMSYWRLKQLVRKLKPDLLHSALWSANILTRLVARSLSILVISDLHSDAGHHGWFRNWFDKKTAHIPARHIAVCEAVRSAYIQNVIDIRDIRGALAVAKRITVVPNGIDADMIATKKGTRQRSEFGLRESDFVIGSVGRLEPIKSYDVLIGAFAAICARHGALKQRQPKLMLVGDGSQRAHLEKLVEEHEISDKVLFVGSYPDARSLYKLFDCFALSSTSEGLSIALLEALAAGLPVVVTNEGFKHEVITHGKEGFLVPIGDVPRLCLTLERLYEDTELARKIGAAGQDRVKKDFSLQNMADSYQTIYQEVGSFSRTSLQK